ncbi:MAG: hypothetical protein KDD89_00140 [Anaerolineales bacterium]|nr:hypothetical protein [Anaerolineales bacterium]
MRRLLVVVLLVLVLAAIGWGAWYVYAGTGGSRTAVCPGPDFFGYICDTSGGLPYATAEFDTFLYEDDGYLTLELPFPFTFYGQPYTLVQAHVNGVLRFGDDNTTPLGDNLCLPESTGDLVAPYWDDLDLTLEGYLRGEMLGEAPNRVIVLEWDEVPLASNPAEKVSFAVHLFETSNDIAFLYEEVNTASNPNGQSATIGIASSRVESSLTAGCNETAVVNGDQIRFVYPEEPAVQASVAPPASLLAKQAPTAQSDFTAVYTAVQQPNTPSLERLRWQWLQQQPPRQISWLRDDITGDGMAELLVLVQSTPEHPHLSQLLVLDHSGQTVLGRLPLYGRHIQPAVWALHHGRDRNNDGHNDILLQNNNGQWLTFTWSQTGLMRMR